MAEINYKQSKWSRILSSLAKAFKIFIFATYGLGFTCAAVRFGVKTVSLAYGLAAAGVYPVAMIMTGVCETLALVCFAAYIWRFAFNQKLGKLSYSTISRYLVIFLIAAAIFSSIDQMQKNDFRYAEYPGYIEDWDVDVLYSTQKCDYSDTLYFEGYMEFTDNNFREQANVQVEYDRALTDAYRIEVHYKGLPSEMYISDDGNEYYISVWTTDYDYRLSVEDYVYMYKNKVDLEYSTPLAIEKIIIRTAYPEKIDVSGIEG